MMRYDGDPISKLIGLKAGVAAADVIRDRWRKEVWWKSVGVKGQFSPWALFDGLI